MPKFFISLIFSFGILSLTGFVRAEEVVCQSYNNYLEPELAEIFAKRKARTDQAQAIRCMPGETALLPDSKSAFDAFGHFAVDTSFPIECVRASMKYSATEAPVYRSCGFTSKRILSKTRPKPCLSENYVSYVHESFVKTMKCAGIDPYEVFPLLNEESGMHLNIGGGGSGIGQMNDGSIAGINERHLVDKILETGGNRCDAVRALLVKADGTPIRKIEGGGRADCEYSQLPYNPTLALMYFAAFYLDTTEKVASRVSKWSKGQLSLDELQQVTAWLVRPCYAAGMQCDALVDAFVSHPFNRAGFSSIKRVISSVVMTVGKRLEANKPEANGIVMAGQKKELVANFNDKISRQLEILAKSSEGKTLIDKCTANGKYR